MVAPARSRWSAAWVAALALAIGAIAGAGSMWIAGPAETASTSRFTHALPASQPFTQLVRPVTIAPDGSSIVYVADNRLYRRVLGDLQAAPIRGTEGAPSGPFFSPDGQFLGYWDSAAEEIRTWPFPAERPSY